MPQLRSHLLIVAAALLLGACSYVDNVLTGEDATEDEYPSPQTDSAQSPPSSAEQNAQPTISTSAEQAPGKAPSAVGAGNYGQQPVAPGGSTGTYVGQKVAAIRNDLQRLQTNINQHNQDLQKARQGMAADSGTYYNQVAAISSHLQVGTTAGNPQLMEQWTQAQSSLIRLGDDITRLSTILNAATADSALAAFILESVRAAYGLQGAVDEDHRQLATIETDCRRTQPLIDRLIKDVSEDMNRQSNYVNNERRNLMALSVAIKNGELYGQNNRAAAGAAPQAASATTAREPLMVIRFDKPNVAYEQALYGAIKRALDRRPNATFDVVAVSPTSDNAGQSALNTSASKRNAETVVHSLTSMGLPPDRINLSAMSSGAARGNEVQVFVR